MDPRRRIPVIALLGVSLTECTSGGDTPAIAGTWTAIEIGADKFPMVNTHEGYTQRLGAVLAIDDDLSGDVGYYSAASHDGIGQRSEQRFSVTVDDADAPHYVITIDSVPNLGYDEGGYDDGDAREEEEDDDDLDATPGLAGGAAGAGPGLLRSRPSPRAAKEKPVFDCQLGGDRLDCTLTHGAAGEPIGWKFARQAEDT